MDNDIANNRLEGVSIYVISLSKLFPPFLVPFHLKRVIINTIELDTFEYKNFPF